MPNPRRGSEHLSQPIAVLVSLRVLVSCAARVYCILYAHRAARTWPRGLGQWATACVGWPGRATWISVGDG
eukprot:13382147-Alexandrium_andersonii.AAC.1